MKSRSLYAWCMDHPIGTVLLTFALVLLGILAFPRLSIAPLPEADFPTIQVNARLPGASAETMASSVATPLEVALSSVPGITEMTSFAVCAGKRYRQCRSGSASRTESGGRAFA